MEGKRILDFRMNTNPLGPPEQLYKLLEELVKEDYVCALNYPDYANTEINKAIAEFLHLPLENVAVANGSFEGIFAIARFVDSARCSIVEPTFWGYAAALDSLNIAYERLVRQESKGFEFDVAELEELASKSTLLFLCNPNNPTATYVNKADLLPIVERFPKCHFLLDEAHLLLKPIYEEETLAQEVTRLENLTIVYSTSKLYNVGGLRTGIIISNKDIIGKFKVSQIPYSINSITQKIFVALLKDRAFVAETRKSLHVITDELRKALQEFSWLEVFPTTTHFILSKIITDKVTATSLAERLLVDGFAIRECVSCYSDLAGEWIRISTNTEKNNIKLISTLNSYSI